MYLEWAEMMLISYESRENFFNFENIRTLILGGDTVLF